VFITARSQNIAANRKCRQQYNLRLYRKTIQIARHACFCRQQKWIKRPRSGTARHNYFFVTEILQRALGESYTDAYWETTSCSDSIAGNNPSK